MNQRQGQKIFSIEYTKISLSKSLKIIQKLSRVYLNLPDSQEQEIKIKYKIQSISQVKRSSKRVSSHIWKVLLMCHRLTDSCCVDWSILDLDHATSSRGSLDHCHTRKIDPMCGSIDPRQFSSTIRPNAPFSPNSCPNALFSNKLACNL